MFSKQMQEDIFKKEYLCLIDGKLDNKTGVIDSPIGRKPGSIIERCIDYNGKSSKTFYKILEEFENYSLVLCRLETGRTHQIRVHFSSIGHPLLGDTLYGKPSHLINRQALHSYRVTFIHPITKKEQCFTCPIPNDIGILVKSHFL